MLKLLQVVILISSLKIEKRVVALINPKFVARIHAKFFAILTNFVKNGAKFNLCKEISILFNFCVSFCCHV